MVPAVNFFSALLSKQKLFGKTDRKKDRQKSRKKDRKIFQLTHQNKSCSECQLDARKIEIERQKDRKTEIQTDRQTD